MSAFHHETVLSVRHWTDRLFSFRTTRTPAFRFRSGQFVIMGLKATASRYSAPIRWQAPITTTRSNSSRSRFRTGRSPRACSTSRRATRSSSAASRPARGDRQPAARAHAFLLGTGTGLAPFLSIVRDPEAYDKFDRIVVAHGVRWIADLAYSDFLQDELPNDELIGELVRQKLIYYPTVTREPFRHTGRLSAALTSGAMTEALGLRAIDAADDRFMLCGSPAMLADLRAILDARGFEEGNTGEPGDYVIEKAFVDK